MAISKEVPGMSLQGRYDKYLFTVTWIDDAARRTALFSTVLADDAAVVGTLREVVRLTYGDNTISDAQPVVEVVDERNYITFKSAGTKIYFQLFKNSRGEVGSAQFWREEYNIVK